MKQILLLAMVTTIISTQAVAKRIATTGGRDTYTKTKTIKTSNIPVFTGNIHHTSSTFKPFMAKKIMISSSGAEINLDSVTADYKGKLITPALMNALKQKVMEHFIAQGYLIPLLKVSNSKQGLLSIDVKLAGISDVVIIGHGSDNKLIRQYGYNILALTPATVKGVQKYIALMNKLPGYEVNYELKQNFVNPDDHHENNIDLVLTVVKIKASTFIGIDNFGTSNLGKYQASGVVQVNSPFERGESFIFNGATTDKPERMSEIGFGYSQPINSQGTDVYLLAAHSSDNPTKDQAASEQDSYGNTIGLGIKHHLYLTAKKDLQVTVYSSYKDMHTYEDIGGISQKSKNSKYCSGEVSLKYAFEDSINGRNLIVTSYEQGLDGKFKNNISNSIVNKHYNAVKVNVYREQPLANNFSIFAQAAAKHAHKHAPSSETFSLGGRDFGRGYKIGTLHGVQMTAISVETRYTHPLEGSLMEHIQPYVFYDAGHMKKRSSSTSISTLQSAGGGVRLSFQRKIDLGIEVAAPFKTSYVFEGTSHKAKTKLGFFINKVFEF